MIDVAARGTLNNKTPEEAYNLLEEMASNSYQWPTERIPVRKASGDREVDAFTAIAAQIEALNKKIDNMSVSGMKIQNMTCDFCGGGHVNTECQGSLPSNTEKNPIENVKAITLGSGKQVGEEDTKQEISRDKEEEVKKQPNEIGKSKLFLDNPKPYVPPVPFPQRLQQHKIDKQFSKFLDVFKKLHINIPFADALAQMPSYAKFLKEIFANKRKLEDYKTVKLNEECSAILQNKLPPKLKDPGSFTIPCTIGDSYFEKALCDLGASINLMPFSVFRKLGLGEVKATTVSLQLADRSIKYPRGIVEDVLVKVDKFIFPADFIVLDMEEDFEVPLILGRPFLATGRALIDVQQGKLILRVQDDLVSFNVFKAMKYPSNDNSCFRVETVDKLVNNVFQENIFKDPLEAYLMEEKLLRVLREHKGAIGWKIADIKGISSSICMHKILMEEQHKPTIQPQRRLNPKMQEVVKAEEGIVLGHKISRNGIEVDRAKVEVIAKLPPPTSVKLVRGFLGDAGFYRRFIKDFSKIARPLSNLLVKDALFNFTDECVQAFNTLKEK
ncbi:uncharacterized protein LOC130138655 [Syzygium oleosum]|uniref:uncharacterized protein LOC130138655 n=1 Tax=Syzygium oleosum TaxID=219896 RepID=UPI0024B9ECF6|nr:uncharacterized protein LOC130138655 [Syzygium oleosum]